MKYIFPAYLPLCIIFYLYIQYLYHCVEGGEQLIILYYFVPRKWSNPRGIPMKLHFIH